MNGLAMVVSSSRSMSYPDEKSNCRSDESIARERLDVDTIEEHVVFPIQSERYHSSIKSKI